MTISVKLKLSEEQSMRVYELARRKRLTVKQLVSYAILEKLDREYHQYFPPKES